MSPGQLRLGEAWCLAHHRSDFLVRIPFNIVEPDDRAARLREALECGFQIHPEMAVFLALAGDLVVELIGVPVLVPADPHQRLAGGDGTDPAPQATLFPIATDAPAH